MGKDNIRVGKLGEEKARGYLLKKGYEIIENNYRCRRGELDIIAMEDEGLVVVEVKTRRNFNYGLPCEAIDYRKKKHMIQTTNHFLSYRHGKVDIQKLKYIRFDVIEILLINGKAYVRHLENAFQAS